ncbi:MAG: energy transducer TonB [Candidatus Sulfotelmatobacter sp.]
MQQVQDPLSLSDNEQPPGNDLASLPSGPAVFWPDVFIDRGLPWPRFLQSGVYHILVLAAFWAGSRFLASQTPVTSPTAFTHSDVIYYTPSEYLPPLDTRRSDSAPARQADPEYSAQPIISLPPQADNHSQTIVTAPTVQLHADVALPNAVSLLEKMPSDPRMPIGPAPAVPASELSRLTPLSERSVIAPPPEVQDDSHRTLSAPRASVIAPPPAIEVRTTRRLGDLDIGHSAVIAPAPQLALDAQHTLSGRTSTAMSSGSTRVIAPPPALGAAGRSRSTGGLVALNLHPAVGAPADPPAGNRRGTFAATPEGHRGASGAAGASTGDTSSAGTGKATGKANGSGNGRKTQGDLPSGLYVGKAPASTSTVAGDPAPKNSSAYSVNPNLIANVRPSRLSARGLQSEGESKLSQEERVVFGSRKFYSLSLNMPNLNSAGGSWIIRFAALRPDSGSGAPSSGALASADLSSPVATRKVDPAYPLELMRQNLGGTVIIYAVIHADGTVGSVRVLRSIDDRLDQYASEAISKWQFQPATKNGTPVDVEATFWIPFHPTRAGSNF